MRFLPKALQGDDRIVALIERLALLLALTVTLLIPLGYSTLEYANVTERVEGLAMAKTGAITDLISGNPRMWWYQVQRIEELLARNPAPIDKYTANIYDAKGLRVVSLGEASDWPVLAHSHPLFDSGQVVGRIEIIRSLRPFLYQTALAALLGLLLGGAVYFLLRIGPLRALRRMHLALEAEQAALRSSELKFRTLFESTTDAHLLFANGRWIDCNAAAATIFGCTRERLMGSDLINFSPPMQPNGRRSEEEAIEKTRLAFTAGPQFFEWEHCRADGTTFPAEVSLIGMDLGGKPHLQTIVRDITERKQAENRIRALVFSDPLTDLPNRRLLMDRLDQALATGQRHAHQGALLFIDLDNFKTLNDTLGHQTGDSLLKQVAQRLLACMREGDTVARLGGDEFIVLLEDLSQNVREAAAQARVVSVKILETLGQPYKIEGQGHHSTACIGVTLFGGPGRESTEEPLKRAELAMYQAKAAGRNTLRFFEPEMGAAVATRAIVEAELRRAVTRGEFVLYYQPQGGPTDRFSGVEALVRWQHPEQGLVSPTEFIPVAEASGLILPIGRWVLEAACKQLAAWGARPEMSRLSMAVNVSARQFRQPNFVAEVLNLLNATGAKPERLKLELTESVLVDNMEDIIVKMNALKAKGVGFSIDDFGTGYSSLSYLKRLPLDQLKIDQGFIRDILTDPEDAAIAKMVVALADSLGLVVIAEGVETEAQRVFLANMGCRNYQGYLLSKPLPIDEFERFAAHSPEVQNS